MKPYLILFLLLIFSVHAEKRKSLFETYNELKKKNSATDQSQYRTYVKKADGYLNNADFENALSAYKMALKYVETSELYNKTGMCYESLKQTNEAVVAYEKSLQLDRENTLAANNLGFLLVKENIDLEKGLSLCYWAYKKNPESKHVIDSLGYAFFKNKRYKSAIYKFRDALRIDPAFFPAILHLAELYSEINEPDLALEFAKEALKYKPDSESAKKIALLYDTKLTEAPPKVEKQPVKTQKKPESTVQDTTDEPDSFVRLDFFDTEQPQETVPADYTEAMKLYKSGDLLSAKGLFLSVYNKKRTSEEYRCLAARFLAVICAKEGNESQAKFFFEKSRELSFSKILSELERTKDTKEYKNLLSELTTLNIRDDYKKLATQKILQAEGKIILKPLFEIIYVEMPDMASETDSPLTAVLVSEAQQLLYEHKYSEALIYINRCLETVNRPALLYNKAICEIITGNPRNAFFDLANAVNTALDPARSDQALHLHNCLRIYMLKKP